MTAVRPRQTFHSGVVRADGLLLSEALLGEPALRARALDLWSPGTVVLRVPAGLLLLPPEPLLVRCDAAPGQPLVRVGGVLCGAPLTPAELSELDPPRGAIVLVEAGVAVVLATGALEVVDPATWLDLGPLALEAAVVPVADLPEIPALLTRPRLDLAHFAGAPRPVPPELDALARALDDARTTPRRRGLRRLLAAAIHPVARLWSRLSRREPEPAAGRPARDADLRPVDLPRPPGPFTRWRRALGRVMARWLGLAGLGALIGRRHARYIARLLQMFEKGALDEALRHALPLTRDPTPAVRTPPLGPPRPRERLRVSRVGEAGVTGVALHDALYEQLRATYQTAFNRLRFQERTSEAAFVLAELLDEPERAVELCETAGELRLAAEIAEARALPAGLVVRQWFLAGDTERAVRLARRSGAFGDAVLRLERTDPDRAAALRVLWARALAESGDFAAAVDVVWAAKDQRPLAREWMDRAIDVGGGVAARMLARKAALCPAEFGDVCGRALALLDDDAPDTEPARRAFIETLEAGPATPETATLARPALRAAIRDRAAHGRLPQRRELEPLLALAGDAALRADLRRLTLGPAGDARTRERPAVVRLEATGGGGFEARDAALTPDGRVLVALGEAGARLVTPDGRLVAHFEVPTDRLVLSDTGDRALALAVRGQVLRVSRLDLAGRVATAWGEVAATAWAPTYDGSMWFVANGDAVEALDAVAPTPASLWRVGDLGGEIPFVARSPRRLSFIVEDPTALDRGEQPWELWTYALPDPRLRHRFSMDLLSGQEVGLVLGLAPEGVSLGKLPDAEGVDGAGQLVFDSAGHLAPSGLSGASLPARKGAIHLRAVFSATHVAVPRLWLSPSFASDIHVFNRADGALELRVDLAHGAPVAVRLQDRLLTLVDDRGRVTVVDLERGALVRTLRL